MKQLILSLLFTVSLTTAIAQPGREKAIEADLRKSFNRINYWVDISNQLKANDTWLDSIGKANNVFAQKLKSYGDVSPSIITQPLKSLAVDINIQTSADGLFRIYSWNTGMGGTMYNCDNVIQYKSGAAVKSVLILGTSDWFNLNYYFKIYSLAANNQTYYLAVSGQTMGGYQYGESISAFTINNGILDDKVKIIKTASGLHNLLSYTYAAPVNPNNPPNQDIEYDAIAQTISLPVVLAAGRVTKNRIIYKFTGQYFERVKN
jgi:hypothetical protein